MNPGVVCEPIKFADEDGTGTIADRECNHQLLETEDAVSFDCCWKLL